MGEKDTHRVRGKGKINVEAVFIEITAIVV